MDFKWLDSVGFFAIDLGLDRMLELLKRLGNPERSLRFIHVAGSNGKGSVCTFLENGLRGCGYSTGFYSSPHLIRLAERFRINGKTVADAPFERAAETVRPVVESMRGKGNGPTYFEITTAIAAVLFAQQDVDFVVWETGLGWVMTSHASQGMTADHVVVAAEKMSKQAFYVGCSRGKFNLALHVPEKEYFKKKLMAIRTERLSVHDLLASGEITKIPVRKSNYQGIPLQSDRPADKKRVRI